MMDEDDEQVFGDLQRAALSHELDQIFASAGIECESGNSSNVVDISDFEIISAGDLESHLTSSFASDVTDNVIVPSEPDNSLRVLEAKPKSKSAGADGVGHLEHSSLEPNVIADYRLGIRLNHVRQCSVGKVVSGPTFFQMKIQLTSCFLKV